MRRMVLAALAVLALAAFAACGNDDDLSIETPEGDVELDPGTDGEGSIEFEGPEGEGGTVEFGGGELPEEFPEDFPLPEGDYEVIYSAVTSSDGELAGGVALASDDSSDDLGSYYESALPDAGFEIVTDSSYQSGGASVANYTFEGNGINGTVTIGLADAVPVPLAEGDVEGTVVFVSFGGGTATG